ncbi:transcription termination factor Rho [Corynebacterium sp. CNCTC7651]|uniref:transcription termination factor Rho n=1 Tax=Corynebacterium sp. CNCTC7651 TaxID=2815361 RepID=UPI001F353628|nr:transcription termination factor Rho [Corynebacterium sp. CNCTC7651]UIZ92961.1 transcription termination factor Rho [Corynebacterium sp. CNCTC7651]
MTETGNAANGRDLAALKLPELRKIASEQGLKGVSTLRKGELIQAITTGQVPAKAAAKPAREAEAGAGTAAGAGAPAGNDEPRQAGAREAAAHEGGQERGAGDSGASENGASEVSSEAEQRHESRAAARRARRNRSRAQHEEGGEDTQQTAETREEREPREQGETRGQRAERPDERRDERRDEREGEHTERSEQDERHDGGDADRGGRERNGGRDRDGRDNRDRDNRGRSNRDNRDNRDNNRDGDREDRDGRDNNRDRDGRDNRDNNRDDNDGGNRRGRRGRRNRNRNRDNQGGRDNNRDNNSRDNQGDNQNFEPEELQEVAGIVDVVDNNTAFIRTTGYRQNSADVFVNNKLVRQNGLRSGDAVVGQVRANGQGHSHGNGRNRQRFNQLVRVDSVNGMTPEEAKGRKEFHKLTPLYPNKRLRLETEPNILTTRVIDLVMPIGKGQRALIVSPPKAGKTTILQNIANAIATNNPECYLMVVLVDERPEEVTDMQRSVRGEVIASTFDRPPSEHTAVAELAIERAKRLVEMGQDVVVLLDSITRLGRAYNNSSPASGRILSGGVDSNALYPPKRFLGAARNIEEGGSLTIIATAMVETGSAGDTVIFEEFKGTGNAELKLDRKIAERRVFPAVDVNPSGTRKDELLMSPEEARIMHKLRRILSALDPQQSIDMLIKQLKKTKTNGEFLMGVANSAPMVASQTEEDYV